MDPSNSYIPPISFEELYQAGRLSMPYAEVYEEGYGFLGDPTEVSVELVDPLEAFVDAWAAASPAPTDALLPRR